MSFVQSQTVAITTSAGGAATVLTDNIRGTIRHIRYLPGTIETGATLTFTLETSGLEVMVKANAGTSNVTFSPQQKVHQNEDGADAIFATGNEIRTPIYCPNERVKLVVASGGATKAGSFIIVWD